MMEKRSSTRVPFKVEAQVEAESPIICKEILNLSLGGCLLLLDRDMDPGQECWLRIMMSGGLEGQNVRVKGVVTRSEKSEVAFKFTEIDPESIFHLRNIIRYNAADADAVESEMERHPGLF